MGNNFIPQTNPPLEMKNQGIIFLSLLTISLLFQNSKVSAQRINLSHATIISTANDNLIVQNTAIRTLQEEVARRTSINLPISSVWKKGAAIILATNDDKVISGLTVPKRTGLNLPELKKEGYRILSEKQNGKC